MEDKEALDVLADNIDAKLLKIRKSPYWLATESGETPATISRILNRKNMPGMGVVTRLATALHCKLDDLVPLQKRKKLRTSA